MRTKWIVVTGVAAGVLISGTAVAAATGQAAPSAAASRSASMTNAGLSQAEAERAALLKMPGARVVEAKQDTDGGRAVWNVHLVTGDGTSIEVMVDSQTGAVRRDERHEAEPGDDHGSRGDDDAPGDDHGSRASDDAPGDDHGGRR